MALVRLGKPGWAVTSEEHSLESGRVITSSRERNQMTAGDLAVCGWCLGNSWLVLLLALYIKGSCRYFNELDLEWEFAQIDRGRSRDSTINGKDPRLEQKLPVGVNNGPYGLEKARTKRYGWTFSSPTQAMIASSTTPSDGTCVSSSNTHTAGFGTESITEGWSPSILLTANASDSFGSVHIYNMVHENSPNVRKERMAKCYLEGSCRASKHQPL